MKPYACMHMNKTIARKIDYTYAFPSSAYNNEVIAYGTYRFGSFFFSSSLISTRNVRINFEKAQILLERRTCIGGLGSKIGGQGRPLAGTVEEVRLLISFKFDLSLFLMLVRPIFQLLSVN